MKVLSLAILVVMVGAVYSDCRSTAECAHGQCCLNTTLLQGKRRQIGPNVCGNLIAFNAWCYAEQIYDPTQVYLGSCPCAVGLICQGKGMMDLPWGELGQCVHHL